MEKQKIWRREEYYRRTLELLEAYFAVDSWKKLFLNGGCYWLAKFLHRGIRGSVIMINRVEEHCALAFQQGLYDVTGKIPAGNFHAASQQEICFMEKNYIPRFDTQKTEQYLYENLPDNRTVAR